MSSNIFRVFGIFVLALMVYFLVNQVSVRQQPVTKGATDFITAIADGSAQAISACIDPDTVKVVSAGDRVTTLKFSELNVSASAFSKQSKKDLTYVDLQKLKINKNLPFVQSPEDKLASVPLEAGGRLYLREKGGKWVVFYITDAEQEKQKD